MCGVNTSDISQARDKDMKALHTDSLESEVTLPDSMGVSKAKQSIIYN